MNMMKKKKPIGGMSNKKDEMAALYGKLQPKTIDMSSLKKKPQYKSAGGKVNYAAGGMKMDPEYKASGGMIFKGR